ncbi:MAG: system, lactose/cellobiose family component [Burkholderiaceae bacterium]|nr:system, lactose/cellobiose family component [Burkholderiaceae bacterium]
MKAAFFSRICSWSDSRQLVAIRRGFLLLLPLVIIGALSSTLSSILEPWLSPNSQLVTVQQFFQQAGTIIFGIVPFCLTMTVSYSYAILRSGNPMDEPVLPFVPSIIGVLSFLVMVAPFGNNALNCAFFGTRFLFPALLVAIVSVEIFYLFQRLFRHRWGYLVSDADPVLPSVLSSMLPGLLTVSVFIGARALLGVDGTPLLAALDGIMLRLFGLFDSELLRALLFNLLDHALWFLGIHGNNMLMSIEEHYLIAATSANAAAVAANAAPSMVFTKGFIDVYVFMGGSGTSLALLIAILFNWRGSQQAKLARIGLLPALFNVSELIVFGLPVVLNPVFLIPFVLVPMTLVLTSYLACISGWVPMVYEPIHWTTPLFMGGYVAAKSWHGIALQIINLLIGALLYSPFVRLARFQSIERRKNNLGNLLETIAKQTLNQSSGILERRDDIGIQARQLASALRDAIKRNLLSLAYQPQVDVNGAVVGVEALVRWNYYPFGWVPPNIMVNLAEEAALINDLGEWVLRTACAQASLWRDSEELHGIIMSVNVSPTQLNDPAFTAKALSILSKSGLAPGDIELEITEGRTVAHNEQTATTLRQLADQGFRLSIDDFGMGYSSLLYMRRFDIHAIKLDGSLTREVLTNPGCQEIIGTIATLCKNKSIRIIAEFVETDSQRAMLEELGCTEFQGYLYSPPLNASDCSNYIVNKNRTANALAAKPTL